MSDIYSRVVAALEYLSDGDTITAACVLEDLAAELHPQRTVRLDEIPLLVPYMGPLP